MRNLIKLKSLFILCLVICFLSSCGDMNRSAQWRWDKADRLRADSLEVGQIWRYYGFSENDPFKAELDQYEEIVAIKNGWVQYKLNGKLKSRKATMMWIDAECTNCR